MNTKGPKASENNNLVSAIRSVILEWDPYHLIADGAPHDEFDGEISRIAARSAEIRGPEDGVRIISEVFSRSFEPEAFTPKLCKEAARRLFNALNSAGVIVKRKGQRGASKHKRKTRKGIPATGLLRTSSHSNKRERPST
jgi:hypothetical protein